MVVGLVFVVDVFYEVDGEVFIGYFVEVENFKGFVLIVYDWDGMIDYECKCVDMLVEMGYNVFVLDMFGNEMLIEIFDYWWVVIGVFYKDCGWM